MKEKAKDLCKKIKLKPIHIVIAVLVLFAIVFSYYFMGQAGDTVSPPSSDKTVEVPYIGTEIDMQNTSLLLSAIIIGLLDGFNPCAMWVLIYLITLVANLGNRTKMWTIVGTFLFASGVLYFIILTGWFSVFSLIGYSQWILYLVGGFALWAGIYAIYDFIKKGGHIQCEVGDLESKRKTMNKMKEIVHSPLTIASFFATVALAFAVNSIEFVCSAGLPAMFTQMLAIADISLLSKYIYILTYVISFLADDLLVFSLALMAIDSAVMHKYSGLSKLVGGIIMIIIGIVLLFFPGILR